MAAAMVMQNTRVLLDLNAIICRLEMPVMIKQMRLRTMCLTQKKNRVLIAPSA